MTRTSQPASASAVSGPVAFDATVNPSAVSAPAARKYDESPGWAGCIAAARSGRIVHASLCASSNSTVASAMRWSVATPPAAVDADIDVISARNQSMDTTDRQILALLVDDGRRTYDDVARHVALSAPAVKRRVDKLRSNGALRGFTAVVDHAVLGDQTEALIELFFAPGTPIDDVVTTLPPHT